MRAGSSAVLAHAACVALFIRPGQPARAPIAVNRSTQFYLPDGLKSWEQSSSLSQLGC